jgi:hypothetical protein
MSNLINLLHILIFVPFFFYLYWTRENVPSWMCKLCIFIGVTGLLYHFYKVCTTTLKYTRWVYLVHIWYVFPLLIYIGFKCKAERMWFEALLLFAFAALGYHSFNLVKYNFLTN